MRTGVDIVLPLVLTMTPVVLVGGESGNSA